MQLSRRRLFGLAVGAAAAPYAATLVKSHKVARPNGDLRVRMPSDYTPINEAQRLRPGDVFTVADICDPATRALKQFKVVKA